MKNEKGFTLIEMMIVLMIISVLLIITIPNVTKNNGTINKKGCDAYIKMVEAQVHAYEIEKNQLPTNVNDLITEQYIKAEYIKDVESVCGKGKVLEITSGVVTITTP